MGLKINKLFSLFFLILLQSCAGGKIGNFLESSFKDLEENQNQQNFKKVLTIKKVSGSDSNFDKNDFEEDKLLENTTKNVTGNLGFDSKETNKKVSKNNKVFKSEEKLEIKKKNKNINNLQKKIKYNPQSYKIIMILNGVDPKAPIEDLSNILRKSDINFEIEKIEVYFDNKNNQKKNENKL